MDQRTELNTNEQTLRFLSHSVEEANTNGEQSKRSHRRQSTIDEIRPSKPHADDKTTVLVNLLPTREYVSHAILARTPPISLSLLFAFDSEASDVVHVHTLPFTSFSDRAPTAASTSYQRPGTSCVR